MTLRLMCIQPVKVLMPRNSCIIPWLEQIQAYTTVKIYQQQPSLKTTCPPQSNLERARYCPIGYNGMSHIYPQNCPFPSTSTTPSNTPIPQSTQLITPNGIRIQSAILPQSTLSRPTDRQKTDWQTDRLTGGLGNKSTPIVLTLLMESDALKTAGRRLGWGIAAVDLAATRPQRNTHTTLCHT